MSDSKIDLGLSSLLSSSKPSVDLGQSLLSPSKSPSSSSSALNPLAPTGAPASGLGIGDLLPSAAPTQQSDPLSSLNTTPISGTAELSCTLHLSAVGSNKVEVVKAIRAHWDKGLKDSKMLADAAPINLPALPRAKAMEAKAALLNLGASVSEAL